MRISISVVLSFQQSAILIGDSLLFSAYDNENTCIFRILDKCVNNTNKNKQDLRHLPILNDVQFCFHTPCIFLYSIRVLKLHFVFIFFVSASIRNIVKARFLWYLFYFPKSPIKLGSTAKFCKI